jgi:hypothetical protein
MRLFRKKPATMFKKITRAWLRRAKNDPLEEQMHA